jgi:hypothetical protein
MSRRFRLTCARTCYFEIDVEAEDDAAAERLLADALERDPALFERALMVGRPLHRVVEIAAAGEGSGIAVLRAEAA